MVEVVGNVQYNTIDIQVDAQPMPVTYAVLTLSQHVDPGDLANYLIKSMRPKEGHDGSIWIPHPAAQHESVREILQSVSSAIPLGDVAFDLEQAVGFGDGGNYAGHLCQIKDTVPTYLVALRGRTNRELSALMEFAQSIGSLPDQIPRISYHDVE